MQKSGYRKKELMLMSESQEIALGQEADPSIVAEYGLYDNLYCKTSFPPREKKWLPFLIEVSCPFSLKLLIHLWSMPLHCREGMSISTRGIMAHFNNEAEFAGVLGHEIDALQQGMEPVSI